jgi:Fe-S oxidoreductase
MFMEERIGKRINVERTEEALSMNPQTIATECPFCMTMLSDGIKAKNADERVQVRDIAEILADCLE